MLTKIDFTENFWFLNFFYNEQIGIFINKIVYIILNEGKKLKFFINSSEMHKSSITNKSLQFQERRVI